MIQGKLAPSGAEIGVLVVLWFGVVIRILVVWETYLSAAKRCYVASLRAKIFGHCGTPNC